QQLERENEIMLSKYSVVIENFIQYCRDIGVYLGSEAFVFIPTIGVVCEYPNILSRLASDLKEDKEGLYCWDALSTSFKVNKFNSGYFFAQNFMAMASPVFRRGMHGVNNWAPRFIDEFWSLNLKGIDAYLSLDQNRVRVNVDNSCYMEADTWFGARFNEDISQIADGVSHLRPPLDLDDHFLDFLFNDAYALDICWSTKGSIRSFQALEFKGPKKVIKQNGTNFHPVRYIHAEYDLQKHEFRHFDGATQFHTTEEYFTRRDSNFRHNVKEKIKIKPKSIKSFKLNGSIPVEMWTELSSHFFASNPLIYEYLSGGYPSHLLDTLEKLKASREKNT
ncbi:MAG: hypothetical protein LC646_04895, partial [Xanthomonadaceae bacterium]|nr:hypothetical protein [Xanthomonadaceae bacterium]